MVLEGAEVEGLVALAEVDGERGRRWRPDRPGGSRRECGRSRRRARPAAATKSASWPRPGRPAWPICQVPGSQVLHVEVAEPGGLGHVELGDRRRRASTPEPPPWYSTTSTSASSPTCTTSRGKVTDAVVVDVDDGPRSARRPRRPGGDRPATGSTQKASLSRPKTSGASPRTAAEGLVAGLGLAPVGRPSVELGVDDAAVVHDRDGGRVTTSQRSRSVGEVGHRRPARRRATRGVTCRGRARRPGCSARPPRRSSADPPPAKRSAAADPTGAEPVGAGEGGGGVRGEGGHDRLRRRVRAAQSTAGAERHGGRLRTASVARDEPAHWSRASVLAPTLAPAPTALRLLLRPRPGSRARRR